MSSKPMPKYQCHKQVYALKIKEVDFAEDWKVRLVFEDESYTPLVIDSDFLNKHNPQDGGYYVVYENGYASYSPADVFEEGYSLLSN